MKIGIVGAGNIGGTIARKLVAAGHSVKLAGGEGPEKIREKAEKMGATPVSKTESARTTATGRLHDQVELWRRRLPSFQM